MRSLFLVVIVVVILSCQPPAAFGQCANGQCSIRKPAPAAVAGPQAAPYSPQYVPAAATATSQQAKRGGLLARLRDRRTAKAVLVR